MADDPTPQRRASDVPPDPSTVTKAKYINRAAGTAVLLGSIGFLYQLSVILTRATSWDHFHEPAGAGEIVFALVCGLIAVAGALGLDVAALLKGFKAKE